MSNGGRYSIVDAEGDVYGGGMIITLEDNVAKEKQRKKIRKEGVNFLLMCLSIVLLGFLSVFIIGSAISLLNAETPKKTAQNELQAETTTTVHEEIEKVQNEIAVASAAPEVDFYIESVPLEREKQKMLYNAAQEFGVPYELALAVVWRETRFENIYGDGGNAYGYFQIWKKWHGERASKLGVTDLMDAEGNFRVGCSILSDLLKNCGGDVHKALMSYNMGAGGAGKLWRQGITSSKYSRAVVDYMEGLV